VQLPKDLKTRTFKSHGDTASMALNLAKFAYGGKRTHEAKAHLKAMNTEKLKLILHYCQVHVNSNMDDASILRPIYFLLHEIFSGSMTLRSDTMHGKRSILLIPYVAKRLDDAKIPQILMKLLKEIIPAEIACQPNALPMVQSKYGQTNRQIFLQLK